MKKGKTVLGEGADQSGPYGQGGEKASEGRGRHRCGVNDWPSEGHTNNTVREEEHRRRKIIERGVKGKAKSKKKGGTLEARRMSRGVKRKSKGGSIGSKSAS